MGKYIEYEIESLEPIKISSTLAQADNEYSKNYISGSVIRGAYIANYMSIKGVKDINQTGHREKLLQGRLKFFNAYPIVSGLRTYPFPKCFYASKKEIKKFSNRNLNIYLNPDEIGEDYDKVRRFEFVRLDFDNEVMEFRNVRKIDSLHIKKEEKNLLFRYEAIDKGERFKGIVKCENDEDAEEVSKILSEGDFYIGGSKGAGYGRCEIKKILIKNANPETVDFSEIDYDESSTLSIYALSDIIFRDKYGRHKTFIDEEYLDDKLGLEDVKYKQGFIDTEYFSGFNNKWGYRLPTVAGIRAGSIITYEYKGNIDVEKLKRFEELGIGERKQDGFGRFVVLSDLETDLCFVKLRFENYKYKNKNLVDIKDLEHREQFQKILDRIYSNKLKNLFTERVLLKGRNVLRKTKLNQNQIGNLLRKMDIILGLPYGEGVANLKGYFEHINSKKRNSYLRNNDDFQSLEDFLMSEIENINETDFKNHYLSSISIAGFESHIAGGIQEMYEYKVKFLKDFLRLQLKRYKKEV